MKLPKYCFFSFLFSWLLLVFLLFMPKTANAAALFSVKDIITTSRPSAAVPLSANVAVNDTLFGFDNNGSKFLASDSAKLIGGSGTLEQITVASMSGIGYTVFLATKITQIHNKGTAVIVPITAKHTVSFTTINAVPSSGKIKIVFPAGDATNQASPSASGFSFNGLSSSSDLSISGASCGSWTVTASSGLVQCNLNVGITGPASVSIGIGSTTPVLINPTKTAAAGTADTWTVRISTTDASNTEIDSTIVKIGTIESVQVYATVEPTFTFTIAGLINNQAVNVGNSDGCTNSETINTGFNTSSTEVNLGSLGAGVVNRSAQLLTVTTNGYVGYALTATSSGHLIDPSIGYWIADAQGSPTANDTPIPTALTAGIPAFGIHPCGLDVLTAAPDWAAGAGQTCTTGGGTNCYYANPSAAYYYTLAQDTTGPVGNVIAAGNGMTTVEYASTISAVVPAGLYMTVLTYVATPNF